MMLWSCNTGQPQADEIQDEGIRGDIDYEEATAESVRTEDVKPVDVMDTGFEREGED